MLIKLNTDNYFISSRLKEIDSSYFIVFNTKSKKYEVHSLRQAENTFCVGLPFCTLDERTVDFVLQTRVENFEKIIKNIEKNNKKIENSNKKIIFDKIEEELYDSKRYY